jgi:hypothetical protein
MKNFAYWGILAEKIDKKYRSNAEGFLKKRPPGETSVNGRLREGNKKNKASLPSKRLYVTITPNVRIAFKQIHKDELSVVIIHISYD